MSELKLEHARALTIIVNKAFNANIHSTERLRENVDARRAFCSILRDEGNTSTSIGAFLNKDHATILHYVRTIKGLLDSDSSFRERYSDCCKLYEIAKNRIYEIEVDTDEITFLKETISMLKKDIATLNIEKDWLKREGTRLLKISDGWKVKNRDIYEVINLRTKVGTEKLIQKKINVLFNGVYSEEIISYTVGSGVSNGGKL
tara:strand:- start:280 stop:888 length:609 start_codon:yes stop_codon:yes gene_type:complete